MKTKKKEEDLRKKSLKGQVMRVVSHYFEIEWVEMETVVVLEMMKPMNLMVLQQEVVQVPMTMKKKKKRRIKLVQLIAVPM